MIDEIKTLLRLELPESANELKHSLRALESLREPILELRIAAQRKLAIEKERLRHPKDKDYTDFDRITMLSAAVADLQADYELLSGLESLVSDRLNLGYRLL